MMTGNSSGIRHLSPFPEDVQVGCVGKNAVSACALVGLVKDARFHEPVYRGIDCAKSHSQGRGCLSDVNDGMRFKIQKHCPHVFGGALPVLSRTLENT